MQDQVGVHLNLPQTTSSQGFASYQYDGGESNRQSALADFVDERRSSNKQFNSRHQADNRGQSHDLMRIAEHGKESSSFFDARSHTTGLQGGNSSVSFLQSRSSSAILVGADASAGYRNIHTSASQQKTFSGLPQSSSYVDTSIYGETGRDERR